MTSAHLSGKNSTVKMNCPWNVSLVSLVKVLVKTSKILKLGQINKYDKFKFAI